MNSTADFPIPSTSSSSSNWTQNESATNSSSEINQIHHEHYLDGHRERIAFFEMHFKAHQTQLTFAFWFFITIIAKIGKPKKLKFN